MEYILINSYNRQMNRGSGYLYQKFDKNKKLFYQINAMEIYWDEKENFVISNYLEKRIDKNEILINGDTKTQDFKHTLEELFPNELLGQK